MDKRIRRNEICIIGQPRCDYVFSSSRSCFIGYGFNTSRLEVELLSNILTANGIDPVEAGGNLASGQNAFCTKICSKIITSQFCAVFVNNDETLTGEQPNANVNMEYGLMLGFNKHVIPFQKEAQSLPFNVAGLDTIKYTQSNFKERATNAVLEAISVTSPDAPIIPFDQILETFFIVNEVILSPIDNDGERMLLNRGRPLGFLLLNDFTGWHYIYFGVFPQLTAAAIIWRLTKLRSILSGVSTSADLRVQIGLGTEDQALAAREAVSRMGVWIVVGDSTVKQEVLNWSDQNDFPFALRLFEDSEVRAQFEQIASGDEFKLDLTR